MNNKETWWVYKIQCILLYGSHDCITYQGNGYIHIDTAAMCLWLGMPNSRLRAYLRACQDMDMIEDLKIVKGFIMLKVIIPPLA